jgi:membrane associated rhomboid family serine protease
VGAPIKEKPTVTYVLIAVNLAIFGLAWMSGLDAAISQWGMWPAGIAQGEWWRLFTSAFLHGGFLHILFNMYILFIVGAPLERLMGHLRYGVLYLAAAFGGAVASYAFNAANTLSVGASGAVFGIMGAFAVAGFKLRYDIKQILFLVGFNLVIGFVLTGVDWKAHVGGLVTGVLIAAVFFYAPRNKRTVVQVLGVLVVLGILVGITMWRTSELLTLPVF